MYLLQILLPVPEPGRRYSAPGILPGIMQVQQDLTARFGGVTIYTRCPAAGQWKRRGREITDRIIVIEVISRKPDVRWWQAYRKSLESRFNQERIVILRQWCDVV
jgi:hypothetical protein